MFRLTGGLAILSGGGITISLGWKYSAFIRSRTQVWISSSNKIHDVVFRSELTASVVTECFFFLSFSFFFFFLLPVLVNGN